ncbi:MAG: amidohydrolase [Burkholderiaceae bacterium]|nr:amidohydrolase [Burkholderiaceae bacterium]
MSVAIAILSGCSSAPAVLNPPPADQVFINAKVLTVDARFSVAQAFAVKDGRFVQVGSQSDALLFSGPATRVIDLQGRTVIPGLADSHLHTAGGGPGIDLSRTRSLADVFATLAQAAKAAKPGDTLVSNSDWHEAQFKEQRLPTAAELEAAAPGIPVVLVRGGHSYFLNDTALAKYGITTRTPVPAGGAIPVGPDGKLTGELTDAAKPLAGLPPPAPMTVADLEQQQKILNAYGLTSIRVPGISVADYRKFQQLRDSGKATVRYSILLRPRGLADFRTSILDAGIRQNEGDDWVRLWGIKIAVDGGFEGGLMTRPYQEPMGQGGKYFGLRTMDEVTFNTYVASLNQSGWRAAVHAVGDAAVDEVLEGFERAHADKDISRAGWTIEHAFITRPDQYPRIRKLNLNLSVQDHLYLAAPVLKGYWGMERASQVTPVQTYLDEGFMLAGGTDSPVIPLSPFWVMYHFITRDTISDGVYGANQAVASREAVLRMMTINNARLTGEEAVKGSIEVAKLADFAVLSADYMTVAPKDIESLKAVATYVGGRLVYENADFARR